MSTRRKQQRQHKKANPRTPLPAVAAPGEDPPCPRCGGEAAEEGQCGSCGAWSFTCYGVSEGDPDAELAHEDPVIWDRQGRTSEGDLCPSCT